MLILSQQIVAGADLQQFGEDGKGQLQAKAVTQKMEPLRKQQRIAKRIAERSAPKVENLLAMERQQEAEVTRTRTRNGRSYER